MENSIALPSEESLKNYFLAILELSKSGDEFPSDLNAVYPLVYGRKEEAVRALLNEPQFIQDIDYKVLRKAAENSKGGRPADVYLLSVSCLEYFIARKVREVFNVYRQVFHKAVEKSLPSTFSEALRQLADSVDKIEEQKAQIAIMEPKAIASDVLLASNDSITIGEFAKVIGTGQNTLFKMLRDDQYLIDKGAKFNLPFQKYISAGYFKVRDVMVETKGTPRIFPQTQITASGQVYFANRYKFQ